MGCDLSELTHEVAKVVSPTRKLQGHHGGIAGLLVFNQMVTGYLWPYVTTVTYHCHYDCQPGLLITAILDTAHLICIALLRHGTSQWIRVAISLGYPNVRSVCPATCWRVANYSIQVKGCQLVKNFNGWQISDQRH